MDVTLAYSKPHISIYPPNVFTVLNLPALLSLHNCASSLWTWYSKSPAYEPSSCKLSKVQTCPVCQLLCSTTALFKVLYCEMIRLYVLCSFFMCYLCEKYYKPLKVQHYVANCVSWVPWLTLSNLQTNWSYKQALRRELIHTVFGL